MIKTDYDFVADVSNDIARAVDKADITQAMNDNASEIASLIEAQRAADYRLDTQPTRHYYNYNYNYDRGSGGGLEVILCLVIFFFLFALLIEMSGTSVIDVIKQFFTLFKELICLK